VGTAGQVFHHQTKDGRNMDTNGTTQL
jgi:hypothetical protein